MAFASQLVRHASGILRSLRCSGCWLTRRWAEKSECALYERRASREHLANSAKWAWDLQPHRNNVHMFRFLRHVVVGTAPCRSKKRPSLPGPDGAVTAKIPGRFLRRLTRPISCRPGFLPRLRCRSTVAVAFSSCRGLLASLWTAIFGVVWRIALAGSAMRKAAGDQRWRTPYLSLIPWPWLQPAYSRLVTIGRL